MNDEEIKDLIDSLSKELILSDLSLKQVSMEIVIDKFKKIISELAKDYSTYRTHISDLLGSLSARKDSAMAMLIYSHIDDCKQLFKIVDLEELDESILNQHTSDETVDKLKSAMELSLSTGQRLRLSEFDFNTKNLFCW